MAHIHSVYDVDAHFKINAKSRLISNESEKTVIMQGDHNSERFTFEIPRYIDGHDMAECNKVEVHFINIDASTKERNAGVYIVDDMQLAPTDENIIIFSWLISAAATHFTGPLPFNISLCCMTGENIDYKWSTAIHEGITIGTTYSNGEAVLTEYVDVLEAWKRDIESADIAPSISADSTKEQAASAADVYAIADVLRSLAKKAVYEADVKDIISALDSLLRSDITATQDGDTLTIYSGGTATQTDKILMIE